MKSNDELQTAVRALVTAQRRQGITLEEFQTRLEALLYQFTGVTPSQERLMRKIINDLEFIRFTQVPETQQQAIDNALEPLERMISDMP